MGHIHVAAAKTHQVAIGNVRAHHHVVGLGLLQGFQNTGGVARMKATGHIGAADDGEHGGIVAHGPGAKALSQVTVQIHGQGHRVSFQSFL